MSGAPEQQFNHAKTVNGSENTHFTKQVRIEQEARKRVGEQIQGIQADLANKACPLDAATLANIKLPLAGCNKSLLDLIRVANDQCTPLELKEKVLETFKRTCPSAITHGISPETLAAEYKRMKTKILASKIRKLESIQNPSIHQKVALAHARLLPKQREIRKRILTMLHQQTSLESYNDRTGLRRNRKQSIRDLRALERQEQAERRAKFRQERKSYNDYLASVLKHGRDLSARWRQETQKRQKLVKQVMQHHASFEREEIRKADKNAKERIKALKADDEEAYLKLIDQEKDGRLALLLAQTDQFLTNLTTKVRSQQAETSGNQSESLSKDEAEHDGNYLDVTHRIKEEISKQPTLLSGGQLKDYQIKGLQWMVSLYNNHLNGILADEMGLGKTIQTISLIAHLIENKNQSGPYLVIVPLSTMTNWSMEFSKWAPSIHTIEYKGGPAHRKSLAPIIKKGDFQVLLTTYEYIIKDRPLLAKPNWLYLVVDEGHRLKNAQSKLTTVLSKYYRMRFRLILTGTPLQNNLPELWALLNFLLPHIFNSCATFEEWFNTPFVGAGEKVELNEEEMLLIIRRLHKVIRPFILRRMKKDVESELPDKVEHLIKCPMSALQKRLYTMIAQQSRGNKSLGLRRLNNTIMQLRKICNHPFVFPEVESQINPTHTSNASLWRSAGKFEILYRMLPKFHRTGHKVLMFFQMTQIMTIMEDFLNILGHPYLRLDGSTKADDRTELLAKFNNPASEYSIFLLSTRAGGLGLNLQTADTVIIFDSDWNPHQDLQAQDRAHRIGQTQEVRIFRLITQDSVEEYILERAQHKLSLDGKVIQAGKFDHKSTNEERDEMLRSLIEREAENEMDMDVDDADDSYINDLIARSPEELALFEQIDAERNALTSSARLIELEELPEAYLQEDIEVDTDAADSDHLIVRSARTQAPSYNENMSDDQWLRSLEEKGDLARKGSTPPTTLLKISLPNPTHNQHKEKYKQKAPHGFGKTTPAHALKVMQSIFDMVENCKDGSRYRSDLFLELPSKEDYPDYYKVIKRPICLQTIEARILNNDYKADLDAFKSDFDLLWSNAMLYNQEGSWVWEDALVMKQMVEDKIEEMASNHSAPVSHNHSADEDASNSTTSSSSELDVNDMLSSDDDLD